MLINVPLAWIGRALGLFLKGCVRSAAALVCFITLFDIATRNGSMLVSRVRHLVHEGCPPCTAALAASLELPDAVGS